MKYYSVSVLLALALLFSPVIHAKKTLYIQSVKANILDKPSFQGKSIANVFKGDIVEVISKQLNWVKIRSNHHQGWVSAMLLAPTPPLSKKSVFEKLHTSVKKKNSNNVRTRASIQATAAATRGLQSRSKSSKDIDANYSGVLTIESQRVTTKDAKEFHNNLSRTK